MTGWYMRQKKKRRSRGEWRLVDHRPETSSWILSLSLSLCLSVSLSLSRPRRPPTSLNSQHPSLQPAESSLHLLPRLPPLSQLEQIVHFIFCRYVRIMFYKVSCNICSMNVTKYIFTQKPCNLILLLHNSLEADILLFTSYSADDMMHQSRRRTSLN